MHSSTVDPVRLPLSGKMITRAVLALTIVAAAIALVLYYAIAAPPAQEAALTPDETAADR